MYKIGEAFPEFVSTEKIKRRNYDSKNSQKGMRDYLIPVVLAAAFILILIRLSLLQVAQGKYFRTLSDTNRIQTVIIHAPRGTIFDRSGKPLVFNVPGYRKIVSGKTKLIGSQEANSLLAKGEKDLEIDSLRQYEYKDAMSHLLGYIGQISEEELESGEFEGYRAGELLGKAGIEREYESFLKGQDGKQLVEIDSRGKTKRKLGETDPVPGRNITLTLDADIQKKAYEGMRNIKKGALIVSTPKGEILALVSKPSYDPNLFTLGNDYKTGTTSGYQNIKDVITDTENQPFLNRAISGLYPPGSTFKLVTAAAGLENGIIDLKFSVKDTGVIKVGEFSFANWYFTNYGGTEGDVNVIKGIKRSNDIFFYKLAEKVGLEKLSAMANEFGTGKKLGIDLGGEAAGLVPTDKWKKENIGMPWFLGDTYHYGIGQGYLLATPLEVNAWAQTVASSGTLYRPYILKDMGAKALNKNFLSTKTVNPIKQGMTESCAPGGVAWPLFNLKIKNQKLKIDGKNFLEVPQSSVSGNFKDYRQVVVACKTGTAQHGGEHTLPHSWITLFAPAHDPQIVITVLAEESGEGSNVAAPIAKEVLTSFFSR